MLERVDPKAQEALLINELLMLPPVTRQDLEMYELWDFLGQKVLPYSGGFMEQPAPDLAKLRTVRAIVNLGEAVIQVRDKQIRQMEEMYKTMANAGVLM